ncbi:MAG: hypothetical protein G01um101416_820 [Microgenomates group bacterium Gr01-1014_16]|nr:MAG: hypothetical protein G01um101416_820 [Microgenomates group bacterium Gr01-1014_16]
MKWIIKLSAGGLEVEDKSWRWGQDLVRNQEILDKVRWEEEAGEFWKKAGVKGRVTIKLSKDLIFDKEVGEKEDETAFWAEVPIEPEKMGKLIVKRPGKKWLVATNKNLYEAVVKSLKKVRVTGVFPEGEEKLSFMQVESGWGWWPVVIGLIAAGLIVAGAWWWGLRKP